MFVCFWNSSFFSRSSLFFFLLLDWFCVLCLASFKHEVHILFAFVLLLFSFLSNQTDGFMGFTRCRLVGIIGAVDIFLVLLLLCCSICSFCLIAENIREKILYFIFFMLVSMSSVLFKKLSWEKGKLFFL